MNTPVTDTRTGNQIPKSKTQEALPGENQPTVDLTAFRNAMPKIVAESPYLKSIRGE